MKDLFRIICLNRIFHIKFIFYFLIFILFSSCSKNGDPVAEVKKSAEKAILTFGFTKADNPGLSQDFYGVINGYSINIAVPSNTDVSALKATFTSSQKSTIKIGGILQQDKLTANNFSSPVVYTVVAEDGSTQNFTVSILSTDKALITFSFVKADNSSLTEDCIGVLIGTTINVLVSSGADLTALKASYTASPKVVIKVGDTVQQSKVTLNNFTQAVVYTVIAEDGSKQEYNVNVTKKSSAKALLTFGLNKAENTQLSDNYTGTISGSVVSVVVPYNTNLSSFKATFTNSPKSTVKVGNTEQQDKVSVNNFSNPIIYTVTAEDGSTMNYTVTVTCAPNPAKDLLTFSFQKAKNSSLPYDIAGTVDLAAKRVLCTIPAGVGKTNLIATFTLSEKATAKVASVVQLSGVTSNNYTSILNYTIVAEDASTNNYTIEMQGESLPEIVQSRIDAKILALNLHPSYMQINPFQGVQVVPIYTTTFISQKPSSSMPFDAGYIGSDGKVYVTTPFTAEQKAVFKDATQAAIYYMCQLFLSNYYMKNTFPIWFKFGMAAFEAGLTIQDDAVKSAIMNWGGQLPSLSTLNDPALFASNNGIAIAYMWGEFIALNKTWQYYDFSDVNAQTVVVANWWSVAPLENLYAIWTRYVYARIQETNNLKRRRFQSESPHFKYYCADKDAFCIPGFTEIIEKAYTEYTTLMNITFPEKLAFCFSPECEAAVMEGTACRNWYTSGTGIVSGIFTSSPSTLDDMYKWDGFLRHEFAHSVVFRLNRNYQPTAWLSEGAADFFSVGVMDQKRIGELKPQVREAMRIATNFFGHRPNYEDSKLYPSNPYFDYYVLGETMLNFIYQKGGYAGVKNVLTDAENGFKSLGFADHNAFMNAYYVYYDSVWNN